MYYPAPYIPDAVVPSPDPVKYPLDVGDVGTVQPDQLLLARAGVQSRARIAPSRRSRSIYASWPTSYVTLKIWPPVNANPDKYSFETGSALSRPTATPSPASW